MLFARVWIGGVVVLLSLASPWAAAQSGRTACAVNGRVVSSSVPCAEAPAPGGTVLRQYGSASLPTYTRSLPQQRSLGDAEEHVKYLGAECASISEGIRTGPNRGVPHGVIADLRKEYQRKCSEDERDARSRASDDQKRLREDDRAARTASQQTAALGVRHAAQCDELLRSLSNKRRRIETLNAGEKEDLARFQAQYEQRCKRTQ